MIKDWSKLRLFTVVAKYKNISKAASELEISQPALSRQISALEAELKTKLFNRTYKGLELTSYGSTLFNITVNVYNQLENVNINTDNSKKNLEGNIVISSPPDFGNFVLSSKIAKFKLEYPNVNINFNLSNNSYKHEELTPTINFSYNSNNNISINFYKVIRRLYASKNYLQKFGYPIDTYSLMNHKLLTLKNTSNNTLDNWLLHELLINQTSIYPVLELDSLCSLMFAVNSDLGIALLPDYLIKYFKLPLENVLPSLKIPDLTYYLNYSKKYHNNDIILEFQKFLINN